MHSELKKQNELPISITHTGIGFGFLTLKPKMNEPVF